MKGGGLVTMPEGDTGGVDIHAKVHIVLGHKPLLVAGLFVL
jgi:hypothetical protein